MPGCLYLVATPIGNLGDVTARAAATLAAVDTVVCEDTRHSRILLEHLNIQAEVTSLPAFDERGRAQALVDRLLAGSSLALITDAGSPGLCDPGEALVQCARASGVAVVPIPGPTALVAALTASGFSCGRFHFLGFLPRQVTAARAMIEEVAALRSTLALYESPKRLNATFELLASVLDGQRRACVARELTKIHEGFIFGTLGEFTHRTFDERGEVVVLVEGAALPAKWETADVDAALATARTAGAGAKDAAREVARASGWTVKELYRRAVEAAQPSKRDR